MLQRAKGSPTDSGRAVAVLTMKALSSVVVRRDGPPPTWGPAMPSPLIEAVDHLPYVIGRGLHEPRDRFHGVATTEARTTIECR